MDLLSDNQNSTTTAENSKERGKEEEEREETKVVCLVRGKNDKEARKRLMEKFEKGGQKEWMKENEKKIKVIAGDLSEKDFGLDKEKYKELSQRIEIFIHLP